MEDARGGPIRLGKELPSGRKENIPKQYHRGYRSLEAFVNLLLVRDAGAIAVADRFNADGIAVAAVIQPEGQAAQPDDDQFVNTA